MNELKSRPCLSKRELEVLALVSQGRSNQQIADELVISIETVKSHLKQVFFKMRVRGRTEAAARAIIFGWVQ
ncbi:MAG: helix-turn-helix transcriptional regulator [Candidatus Obscuribacterales bacterium]|nr:helix-turn-helix transcriptional regulator [Candidatus Obscuribacterales bacterium]